MKYLELFSGIGGFREALNILSKDTGIECKCVGRVEPDEDSNKLYEAHFNPSEDEFAMSDLHDYRKRLESGRTVHDLGIGDVDMVVARLQRESYKIKKNEAEGATFFSDVKFIVERCMPEFVVMEAPRTVVKSNNGTSFQHIFQELGALGYHCNFAYVNPVDFDMPQDRPRAIILATLRQEPTAFIFDEFEIRKTYYTKGVNSTRRFFGVLDVLDKEVKDLGLWITDSCKEWLFATEYNGSPIVPKINNNPALSLKQNMSKMQRSNQDNYYSYDFINSHGEIDESSTLAKDKFKKIKRVRRLSHVECLRLQGFPDSMFEEAMWAYIGDTSLYKIIATTPNVNSTYAVLKHIILSFGIC